MPSSSSNVVIPGGMGPLMASLRPLPQRSISSPASIDSVVQQQNQELEGYMQKEGGGYKSWRKRYFVLKGGRLEYYADKDGKRIKKGELNMNEVSQVMPSMKARVPHCMDIVTPKRVYKFGCINESDKVEWMKAIQSWVRK